MNTTRRQSVSSSEIASLEEINEVAEAIAAAVDPDKIILFGSYAQGRPDPLSDVDMLVVVDSSLTPNQQRRRISRTISPKPFGLDIVVRSGHDLVERVELGDWFLRDILEHGKVLYERPR